MFMQPNIQLLVFKIDRNFKILYRYATRLTDTSNDGYLVVVNTFYNFL